MDDTSRSADVIDDVRRLLHPIDPVGPEELSRSDRERLAQVLDSVAHQSPASGVLARRSFNRSRLLAGTGIAAGLTAVLTVALVGGQSQQPASATPALPQPLAVQHGSHAQAVAALAAAAAQLEGASSASLPVLHAKTQNYSWDITVNGHRSSTVVSTTVRDVWLSPDRTAVVSEHRQDTMPAGGDVGAPQAPAGINHSGTYKAGAWDDPNVGFPTDPHAAYTAMLHSAQNYQDFAPAVTVGDDAITTHLAAGTATAAQTAAIYRALAELPGVFDAGTVVDNAGRSGIAIGVVVSGPGSISTGTDYVVIDPATGKTLQTEQIAGPNPPPALHLPPGPMVYQYSLIITQDAVNNAGAA